MLHHKNRLGFIFGAIVLVIGVGALAGWMLDIQALKTFGLGPVSMKANAALSFFFAGIGLMASSSYSPECRIVTKASGSIVAGIGIVTLAQYILGIDAGIDQFIALDAPAKAEELYPGRMSPVTAFNLALGGMGLLLAGGTSRQQRIAQALAYIIIFAALLNVLGHLYSAQAFYQIGQFTAMAPHAALAFLAVGIALLLLIPEERLVALLFSDTESGKLTKLLLPAAIIVPVTVGGLTLWGWQAGQYDTRFEHALFTLLMVILFTALISWSVKRLFAAEIERAEAARLRFHLAAIVESSDDAIISKNLDGIVTSWNPAAKRMYGYDASEMVGQLIFRIIPEDRLEEEHQILAKLRLGERIDHYETIRQTKDGRLIPVSITISPIRDEAGNIIGASKISQDITERKRAEEALMRSNQELDDFAYIASHDLKEPLRGIHNYAMFLNEDYGDKLDAEGKAKLESLKTLSQRMEALINSLLEFSRLGRVDMAIQDTDLNAVVSEVLESLEFSLKEQHVAVRMPRTLPTVRCDRVRVGEVFRNLITNGMKYNDKLDKLVEIGYREVQPPVFYVRDNGIGIPSKHIDTIFRIFKRLHGRDKFGGGTGIGLTIVKKIVDRHRGRIWMESEEGKGTTFYFTLKGNDE